MLQARATQTSSVWYSEDLLIMLRLTHVPPGEGSLFASREESDVYWFLLVTEIHVGTGSNGVMS